VFLEILFIDFLGDIFRVSYNNFLLNYYEHTYTAASSWPNRKILYEYKAAPISSGRNYEM